jgi:hypothetical protein
MVLREKPFKRGSGDRLRRGLTDFPSLESAEFDWQPGGNQSLDRLRLAEFVQGSPCFQLGYYGREGAVLGHQRPMMPIGQNAGNPQPEKFFLLGRRRALYNKVRYRLRYISGHEGTGRLRRKHKFLLVGRALMAIEAKAAKVPQRTVLTC